MIKVRAVNKFNLLSLALAISAISWGVNTSYVLAQEAKPVTNNFPDTIQSGFYNKQVYSTRKLRAVSGPDNRRRWRFFKPNDVSSEAMQEQGCVQISVPFNSVEPHWRCPRQTITVGVDGGDINRDSGYGRYNESDGYPEGNVFYETIVQADSGPDNRGFWRFYRPSNISPEVMQDQGCVRVNSAGPDWRCPSRTIRFLVEGRPPAQNSPGNWYDEGDNYDEYDPYYETILQAESGPDSRGFWRFYKPSHISPQIMQNQGCVRIRSNGPDWRCPSSTIRLDIEAEYR